MFVPTFVGASALFVRRAIVHPGTHLSRTEWKKAALILRFFLHCS